MRRKNVTGFDAPSTLAQTFLPMLCDDAFPHCPLTGVTMVTLGRNTLGEKSVGDENA
jgi:hypothetical protein